MISETTQFLMESQRVREDPEEIEPGKMGVVDDDPGYAGNTGERRMIALNGVPP